MSRAAKPIAVSFDPEKLAKAQKRAEAFCKDLGIGYNFSAYMQYLVEKDYRENDPDRAGISYSRPPSSRAHVLNEPNFSTVDAVKEASKAKALAAARRLQESSQKSKAASPTSGKSGPKRDAEKGS